MSPREQPSQDGGQEVTNVDIVGTFSPENQEVQIKQEKPDLCNSKNDSTIISEHYTAVPISLRERPGQDGRPEQTKEEIARIFSFESPECNIKQEVHPTSIIKREAYTIPFPDSAERPSGKHTADKHTPTREDATSKQTSSEKHKHKTHGKSGKSNSGSRKRKPMVYTVRGNQLICESDRKANKYDEWWYAHKDAEMPDSTDDEILDQGSSAPEETESSEMSTSGYKLRRRPPQHSDETHPSRQSNSAPTAWKDPHLNYLSQQTSRLTSETDQGVSQLYPYDAMSTEQSPPSHQLPLPRNASIPLHPSDLVHLQLTQLDGTNQPLPSASAMHEAFQGNLPLADHSLPHPMVLPTPQQNGELPFGYRCITCGAAYRKRDMFITHLKFHSDEMKSALRTEQQRNANSELERLVRSNYQMRFSPYMVEGSQKAMVSNQIDTGGMCINNAARMVGQMVQGVPHEDNCAQKLPCGCEQCKAQKEQEIARQPIARSDTFHRPWLSMPQRQDCSDRTGSSYQNCTSVNDSQARTFMNFADPMGMFSSLLGVNRPAQYISPTNQFCPEDYLSLYKQTSALDRNANSIGSTKQRRTEGKTIPRFLPSNPLQSIPDSYMGDVFPLVPMVCPVVDVMNQDAEYVKITKHRRRTKNSSKKQPGITDKRKKRLPRNTANADKDDDYPIEELSLSNLQSITNTGGISGQEYLDKLRAKQE
ncbi:uncharacterized protein [Ptychodera flava]|uniref:uncharacterized protein n=1 Tax=Ptychodera flava TaxID=63121 RepID=UPI00396A53AA